MRRRFNLKRACTRILELDSIDAVDMIVHLQKKTGKKIKPEELKAVRTVQDVVDAVERLLKEA